MISKSRSIFHSTGSISTGTYHRGSRVEGYNPNPGGFEGQSPHRSRKRYVSVAVVFDSAQHLRYTHNDHTSFEIQGYNLNPGGLGEAEPNPLLHMDRVRHISLHFTNSCTTGLCDVRLDCKF